MTKPELFRKTFHGESYTTGVKICPDKSEWPFACAIIEIDYRNPFRGLSVEKAAIFIYLVEQPDLSFNLSGSRRGQSLKRMFDKTFNWSKNIRDKSAFRLMGPADYETFLKISKKSQTK